MIHVDAPPRSAETYFPMIDALRGAAALAVLVSHVVSWSYYRKIPIDGGLVVFRLGYIAVFLFFVISGFVILNSALTLYKRHPRRFYVEFMKRRWLRLYPIYLLTLAASLVAVPDPLKRDDAWPNLLTHLTFTHSWFPSFAYKINAPNWSMGPEMHFYVLIIIALPFILRIRFIPVLVVSCLVAWAWRLVTYWNIDHPLKLHVVSSQVPGTIDVLCFGVGLALFMRSDAYARLRQAPRFDGTVRLAAVVAFALLLVLFWFQRALWDSVFMVVFFRTLIAIGGVLAVLAATTINDGALIRWSAPLRYLGVISLGIYLWHFPVMMYLTKRMGIEPDELGPNVYIALSIALTLLLSVVSWHFFEKPILTAFRRSRSADPAPLVA